jgi:diguanylate cyclase (GGDEF)-like protein/PAS domain S-box-containing protein
MASAAGGLRAGLALAACCAVLAAGAVAIGLGWSRADAASRRVQELAEAQTRKLEAVSALFQANGQRAIQVDQLVAAETPDARERAQSAYAAAREEFSQALGALKALPLAPGERPAREAVLAAAAQARAVGERIAELVSRGERALAAEHNLTQAVLADARLQETLYVLLEANRERHGQALTQAARGVREGALLVAAGSLLALLAGALAAWLVVRAARRAAGRLAREKELAEVTLHSITDGVITTDEAGRIEYMNPVAEQYLGWPAREARGRQLGEVCRLVDERTGEPLDPLAVATAKGPNGEEPVAVRLVDRSGRECPVRYARAPIAGADGRARGMVVVFHDVSEIRAMAHQLMWQAGHDALTGLVNRREFERRLAELVASARAQGREHALMYMDLDNFKAVNDTCGHSAGDELLRQLTAVMQARMRGSDTLARLGGDEFGALLESCPLEQALRIAHAMRETIREFRFVWEDKTFNVGVSIGLVPITRESASAERALAIADACCYEAKNRGRDRVQVYQPGDRDYAGRHEELQLLAQINRAFERGEFCLYRQRIVPLDAAAGRAPHYEILVRMRDRDGQLVPATGFMPAAERYNLLTSIERWVVSTLVEHLHRRWSDAGRAQAPGAERGFYSVNISGVSINDRSFPDFLRNLLTRYQLPPGVLCFEITETTAISNLSKAAELMHELKGMGCCFALDDFGTGMSSFAYLKYLPVDYLKIAGVFIRDMASDAMDHAIVEAINRISHILGMRTIAESVEDAQTLERIAALGVDYAQGYFIAEPEALEAPPPEERRALSA